MIMIVFIGHILAKVTVLNSLYTLSHLIVKTILSSQCEIKLHHTDEETNAYKIKFLALVYTAIKC